jgi:hypothetical protein
MHFRLIPIIDTMVEFYSVPPSIERFNKYLSILEGQTKGELEVPIAAYNPMAKEHVRERLLELKELHAEDLIVETLAGFNQEFKNLNPEITLGVCLNLADDLYGGWTNRITTDYQSKFQINALVKRSFCTPHFWTSEAFSKELIISRTEEYVFNTLYFLEHGKPVTLNDHSQQLKFVLGKLGEKSPICSLKHFEKFKSSEDYSVIINFLYGDETAIELGFKSLGVD